MIELEDDHLGKLLPDSARSAGLSSRKAIASSPMFSSAAIGTQVVDLALPVDLRIDEKCVGRKEHLRVALQHLEGVVGVVLAAHGEQDAARVRSSIACWRAT